MKLLTLTLALILINNVAFAQPSKELTDAQIEQLADARCKSTFNLKDGTQALLECKKVKIEEAKQRREERRKRN